MGKNTEGNYCAVLDAKGGVGLYALCSSITQGKNFEGCRSRVCSFVKLDEVRLLEKLTKCEISETSVNSDKT